MDSPIKLYGSLSQLFGGTIRDYLPTLSLMVNLSVASLLGQTNRMFVVPNLLLEFLYSCQNFGAFI